MLTTTTSAARNITGYVSGFSSQRFAVGLGHAIVLRQDGFEHGDARRSRLLVAPTVADIVLRMIVIVVVMTVVATVVRVHRPDGMAMEAPR